MKNETLTVGVAGLKGGCGKSTFIIPFLSHLVYVLDLRVVAIDADDPQLTLFSTRDRNIKTLADPAQVKLQKKFVLQNKEIYPIYSSNTADAPELIRSFRKSGKFDLIIVDTGGRLEYNNSLPLFREMDYIIIPFEAQEKSLDSNTKFAGLLAKLIIRHEESRVKEAFIFWNRMKPNEKKEMFVRAYQELAKAGFKMFNNLVEEKKGYQDPLFTQSTILPIQGSWNDSNIARLIEEVVATLGITAKKQLTVV